MTAFTHLPADCQKAQALLDARLDGDMLPLPQPDTAWLNAHTGVCPECAAYARVSDQLVVALRHLPEVPIPEGLADRVLLRLAQKSIIQTDSGNIIPLALSANTAQVTSLATYKSRSASLRSGAVAAALGLLVMGVATFSIISQPGKEALLSEDQLVASAALGEESWWDEDADVFTAADVSQDSEPVLAYDDPVRDLVGF